MGDFTTPPPNNAPVAIYEDGGGLVTKYQQMAWQYRLENRKVKILGSCRSACVMALSVPNVCVGPNAVVKAHQAYEADTGVSRPDITAVMMSSLPTKIREQLEPNITRNYNRKTTLNYNDLVSLGVKPCDSYRVVKTKPVSHPLTLNPIASLIASIRSKFHGNP
jgi:hypothetical protein